MLKRPLIRIEYVNRGGLLRPPRRTRNDDTFEVIARRGVRHRRTQRRSNLLQLDDASWRRRKSIDWQGWQPTYLPPCTPDLNPIGRIWLVMKARWFNNHVCRKVGQLTERLGHATFNVIGNPDNVRKTAAIGALFCEPLSVRGARMPYANTSSRSTASKDHGSGPRDSARQGPLAATTRLKGAKIIDGLNWRNCTGIIHAERRCRTRRWNPCTPI